ncbi:S-adenosyl-L-methionine-dependent methyltransferase [Thozetella sp. PMI_491]|nr:S-adenosyl-L-methionine-dependent methyltransferase [Thozetella sp. PMI_491]
MPPSTTSQAFQELKLLSPVMTTQSILEELQDAADRQDQGDKFARMDLLNGLQKLQNAVLTPDEKMTRMQFQMYQNSCLRLAQEHGIIQELASNGRASAEQLGAATKTDPVRVARIMRLLTIIGVADEVGPRLYEANDMTHYCSQKGALGNSKYYTDIVLKICSNLGVMAQKGLDTDPHAYTFGLGLYEFLQQNHEYGSAFADFMAGRRAEHWAKWFEIFPAKEKIEGTEIDDVLLVDVGGGQGNWTQVFQKAFPDLPGRLIVQDQPGVTPELEGIESMVYDFFTPQPVAGARLYYFKSILHNWDDDRGLQILKNTAAVMKKGYSTLLIDNIVLPEEKVGLRYAYLDIAMMVLFGGGIQRTEGQWKTLIEAAGLKVVKIWFAESVNEGAEAIIECEKA